MSKDDWFYEEVERRRMLFETNPSYARTDLIKKFQPWANLLCEDDESLRKKPSSSRSVRARQRRKARAILANLGPQVLLVCTLATNVTQLHSLEEEHLIPQLENWWVEAVHPKGLELATVELEHSFARSFEQQQRDVPKSDNIRLICDKRHAASVEGPRPSFKSLEKEDKTTIVEFKLEDMFRFLAEKDREDKGNSYQMVCPWRGQPPFANIRKGSFEEASFKIELSVELSSQWFRYIREHADGRTAINNA
ncbi:hypothetical protein LTR22_028452 [Elasticomyces elasticus]|nr:hypothetical protein LTR22_028452 [Elasticomyces elasticus]